MVRLFYEKVKEAPPKFKRTWPFFIKRERVYQNFGTDAHANPGLGLQPRSSLQIALQIFFTPIAYALHLSFSLVQMRMRTNQ